MKTFVFLALAVALAAPLAASAEDATPATPATASQTVGTVDTGTPKAAEADTGERRTWQFKPKKLRFRDKGPVCMCAGGLTEKDIAAGRTSKTLPDLIEPPDSTSTQTDNTHE